MVTCLLLNQTHGRQVRPILDELWSILPNPSRLTHLPPTDHSRLIEILTPLGFVNKRYHALVRNAADYLAGRPWEECYGIGRYGRDALALFVYGRTDVDPMDKWLKPYLEWRQGGGPSVEWG